MPRISIIIPTFNRAHYLGETLDSIRVQTYKDWECIVVDDDSTDYTNELMELYCQKDPRIQFHHRPKNKPKGANACRNFGFILSKGEFINWFDSDDLMLPEFIKDGILQFNSKPKLDLVIADYDIFSELDKKIFHYQRNIITDLTLDYYTGKINFGSWCIIWKKNIIQKFKYDEYLLRAQELDFHFQVFSTRSVNFGHLRGGKILIRRHDYSLTSLFNAGNYQSLKSELAVRKKILAYLAQKNTSSEVMKSALKIYLSTFRNLAKSCSVSESMTELEELENVLKFKLTYRKWKSIFIILLFIYKLSNREYRLKLHISRLTEFI